MSRAGAAAAVRILRKIAVGETCEIAYTYDKQSVDDALIDAFVAGVEWAEKNIDARKEPTEGS